MSSAVAELEAGLQAMLALKPPGVSGSRITSITTLCTANVQSESVLIQKLYTHFKKVPGTHKLGVLYVVDSVTRKWTEQAKAAGQTINSAAADGTYAAGVHRVTELLPVLMNDIIQSAPDDQKEKIKKLVDIWEKGQTFPLQMLTSFKEKLNAQNPSTTPPGSPPPNLHLLGTQQANANTPTPTTATPSSASAPPNTSSILAALANIARQNTSAPPANPSTQAQDSSYNVSNAQSRPAPPVAALNQGLPFPPIPPPVNVPALPASYALQAQGSSNGGVPNFASNQNTSFPAAAPPVSPTSIDPAVQQQLMLIKALSDSGVPHDKIAGLLAAMGGQGLPNLGGAGGMPPQQMLGQSANANANAQNSWGARPDESRDRNGFENNLRSPQRYRRRSRSASPVRAWGARDSPNSRRRDEANYDYGRDSPSRNDRGRGGGRGGRGDYRQRSPPRRGRSPSPRSGGGSVSGGPTQKWIGHDTSIGKGNIKVLSRTLFVGGVTSTEQELRSVFDRYGRVQTCIVNKDKRHAFVKMISREDAVNAKDAMEKNRTPDSQLRTRWGVGFGPRDCSDYQTGVSIIPIGKLTDADRKWMLTAEYGGTGGKNIESGMVVEEPDIEIGQGVSSKAISRRMQTDKGGNNGPKSGRDYEEDEFRGNRRGSDRGDRDNRRERRDDDRSNKLPPASGAPAMPPFNLPGFPYSMPSLPNGMPMFPPGFVFPGQQQQPPPPGHRS